MKEIEIEEKNRVLNEANILLISDNQKDYDEVIKFGFKNVDYFKSIIRADRYFSKNPDALSKYHLILKGTQVSNKIFWVEDRISLENELNNKHLNNNVVCASLVNYGNDDKFMFYNIFKDYKTRQFSPLTDYSYSSLFYHLIENMLLNNTLNNNNLKDKKFDKIEDYVNPNPLKIPTKLADLKVLYLGYVDYYLNEEKFKEDLKKELNLDITFKDDDNSALADNVIRNLGDYDIIIAYSNKLVEMNKESIEQCKDTGRNLTLLVTYNYLPEYLYDENYKYVENFGHEIDLNYSYGGRLAPNLEISKEKFRTLINEPVFKDKDVAKSIIEASVKLYNDALIKSNNLGLKDFNFKTPQEYDTLYQAKIIEIDRQNEKDLEAINNFDNMYFRLKKYLKLKSNGLINNLEGLKVVETKKGIEVTNLLGNRVLCKIVISKRLDEKNLRVLSVQTLSKKGTLNEPKVVGLYTRRYEKLDNIPLKPNEQEMNSIISIEKKVDYLLDFLNIEDLKNRKKGYQKEKRN